MRTEPAAPDLGPAERGYLRLLVILQSLNILVAFIFLFIAPWLGFFFWFIGGYFLLLIQIPLFLVLFGMQVFSLIEDGMKRWRMHIMPWMVLAVCLLGSWVNKTLHLNDLYYGDAFDIEVTFAMDRTCSVRFNGELLPGHMIYRYDRDRLFYCHSIDGPDGSLMFNLVGPPLIASSDRGHTIQPGEYIITDTHGSMSKTGGALFDNELGGKYCKAIAGTVYWDFISGSIKVLSEKSVWEADESTHTLRPRISAFIHAVGRRVPKGP